MTQGERVKLIRDASGLTLEKFGSRVGVTKVAISNIEKGNRSLTDQMTKSICREFDVNETWLRTGEGSMFLEMTREDEIASFVGKTIAEGDSFKNRFIAMLSKLDENDWAVIEKMAIMMENEHKKKADT